MTLGTRSAKNFDVSSLLKFDVNLAIGDHPLTKKEWEQVLATDDHLIFLNKQWVEVNKEKMNEYGFEYFQIGVN